MDIWSIIIVLFAIAELAFYFILPMADQSSGLRRSNTSKRIDIEREKLKLRREQDELLLWEREHNLEDVPKPKKEGE